jgi:acetate kinase
MPEAILALNAGSSSIKFGLFEVREGSGLRLMSKGGIEGVGGDPHFTATDAAGPYRVAEALPGQCRADGGNWQPVH